MVDAVVLAGGKARRLGGADKPGIEIGGVALLGRVVAAVADADTVVVVGPPRVLALSRPVLWCQEEPPGGGPVAALAAGLDVTSAEIVVVLAADLPWIAPAVPDLLAALGPPGRADIAVLTDRAGRRNHLAAAWRRPALVAALAALPAADGAAMRTLFEDMSVSEVDDHGRAGEDCDTWDDVDHARSRVAAQEQPS